MTLQDMRELVMLQTGNDADDVDDNAALLLTYLNDGYDELYRRLHGNAAPSPLNREAGDTETPAPMKEPEDEPSVPKSLHSALCDYATYLFYRNGNPTRQSRGMLFLERWKEALGRVRAGGTARFTGLYDN